MKLGRVIGRVVSTQKLECFEGIKLLLIQPIDENRETLGDALVAVDTVKAGPGEIVFYERSKEAGQVLVNWFNPADAAVIGIVDEIHDGGGIKGRKK